MPSQKVRVAFFRINDVRLELLEPTDPSSPVQAFLEKRGEGLHHLAFTVDDIKSRIAELKQSGLRMIDEAPATRRTPHANCVYSSEKHLRRADRTCASRRSNYIIEPYNTN